MLDKSLPYHLIIPSIISMLILALIFYNRKRLFQGEKQKWLFISVTVFFSLYLLIIGGSVCLQFSFELTLKQFDLNGDGFFSGDEITSDQQVAMKYVISDNARNLSFITGFIFSGIISLFVYAIGRTIEYITGKKIRTAL